MKILIVQSAFGIRLMKIRANISFLYIHYIQVILFTEDCVAMLYNWPYFIAAIVEVASKRQIHNLRSAAQVNLSVTLTVN